MDIGSVQEVKEKDAGVSVGLFEEGLQFHPSMFVATAGKNDE
jgi:hypothetical protein